MESTTHILGISAWYHDSAAALIKDGVIVAAAQEERFSRKKHDPGFPANAVSYVLEEAAISLDAVAAIVFYDKPFLKFERLLETYHAFAPRGLKSFLTSMPVWIREKIFMRSMLEKELRELLPQGRALPPIFFSEHHLSHAASAFFPSPFERAAILTVDGVGEWATTSIARGDGNSITSFNEIHFPHSLGLLYSAFTAYCGFKVNSGEYKLMGLAPYGNPDAEQTRAMEQKILDQMVDVREDGSYALNMPYFNYPVGLRMYDEARWTQLFGIGPRRAESEDVPQEYMNMALAIQRVTETIVSRLAATACERAGSDNLCLAGGVALNCVANGKLLQSGRFRNIWIQPASGDAGGALGAALAYWHIGLNRERAPEEGDSMRGAYLGPSFSQDEILRVCKRFHAPVRVIPDEKALTETVADLLAEGNVVGWFQGRMEYGPRALGNRSILADPRNAEMQKRLNLKIKFREGFRPFAPSVPEEDAATYFDLREPSPYMLLTAPVAQATRNAPPPDYNALPLWERLYFCRSSLPSVTHVDYSARVQTISSGTNPRYLALARSFRERHGCAVLVNTSFNVRGEPVVCSPRDAYLCFMRTDMDYLVMGDVLLAKTDQPPLPEEYVRQGAHDLD
jgi:carbamoyltransferase